MKKKLPKSRRQTRFLQSKKSSPLSPTSIKKTPKRKVKQFFRKLFTGTLVFVGLFGISLGVLWITFHHQNTVINPVPTMFSNVLGTSTQISSATKIAQAKEALRKKNISFSDVISQNGDIVVTLNDDIQVLFSPDKDFSQQIDSLQVTMDHLTIEGKRIARVDVRFERPVVTFK